MNYGQAIEGVKSGRRARRPGWNGKGMWVALFHKGEVVALFGESLPVMPCLVLRNARGEFQPGWVSSQEDVLAEDWEVFD